MTARVWDDDAPEPKDRPAVVCDDGVTARWDEDEWWHRQEIVKHKGYVTGGETCMDWSNLLETYGPLREATADEVDTVIVRYAS